MKSDLKNIILSQEDLLNQILERYDLDEYVLKLLEYATILTYYDAASLKGFIAYYSNDSQKRDAFLTLIIVNKVNSGIGKLLLESSISDLINKGFEKYKLEVLKDNKKAISLYEKYGFRTETAFDSTYIMSLSLNKNAK